MKQTKDSDRIIRKVAECAKFDHNSRTTLKLLNRRRANVAADNERRAAAVARWVATLEAK